MRLGTEKEPTRQAILGVVLDLSGLRLERIYLRGAVELPILIEVPNRFLHVAEFLVQARGVVVRVCVRWRQFDTSLKAKRSPSTLCASDALESIPSDTLCL